MTTVNVLVREAVATATVVVSPPPVVNVTSLTNGTAQVTASGTPGPRGLKGDPGDQGEPGVSGGHYLHVQDSPEAVWTVVHNLGYRPNVTVVDSSGREVVGTTDYPSISTVQLTFSSAFAGAAYLS